MYTFFTDPIHVSSCTGQCIKYYIFIRRFILFKSINAKNAHRLKFMLNVYSI